MTGWENVGRETGVRFEVSRRGIIPKPQIIYRITVDNNHRSLWGGRRLSHKSPNKRENHMEAQSCAVHYRGRNSGLPISDDIKSLLSRGGYAIDMVPGISIHGRNIKSMIQVIGYISSRVMDCTTLGY